MSAAAAARKDYSLSKQEERRTQYLEETGRVPLRKPPAKAQALSLVDLESIGQVLRPLIAQALKPLREEIMQLRNELRQAASEIRRMPVPESGEVIPVVFSAAGSRWPICTICQSEQQCAHREEGLIAYYRTGGLDA